MKRFNTLFPLLLSVLYASAQEQWNAVKVFDFNPYDQNVQGVTDMRIDTVGVADCEFVFSFLTWYGSIDTQLFQKIISTDLNGNVIKTADYPYPFSYYTIMANGDTLISTGKNVINVSNKDTLFSYKDCYHITTTLSGIYVNLWNGKRATPFVMNIVNQKKIFEPSSTNCPMCRSGDGIYAIISSEDLYYYDEHTKEIIKTKINVNTPITGIAEYKGSLYVYSQTDKAVYRLEPPEVTAVYSITELKCNTEPIHYGLDGRIIESSTPGIHILKYPDRKVNKIVVK